MNKILVRGVNWVGDAVMTTPALKALRLAHPLAHITLLQNSTTAPLFMDYPYIDRLIPFRKTSKKDIFALARRLRREKFDTAILLQNAIEAAIIARLAGIPNVYGYHTDGRRLLLSKSVPATAETRVGHHSNYYLRMLHGLDLISAPVTPTQLALPLPPRAVKAAAQWVPDRYAVINPGATYGSAKRWAPERFANVARGLAINHKLHIVVTGVDAEADMARDIVKMVDVPATNLAGKTDLLTLMGVIGGAQIMVTNDSGPMHLAAAFDTPVVAVFGSTDHTNTYPLASRAQVIRSTAISCAPCMKRECSKPGHYCMDAVDPDDVYWACEKVML
ncbi:lipopolysaccharide heptosyltransferase II [Chrysiogenes arsenatis]|uniref:lipopolysaccharide heptosyltransferase II n=1 Tax=Chrysiogenes arsenatis TaxID=309797 RepID=UPI00041E49B1|nr:lipopolysaccharide heptosyltransferase II [Chrysiogenes arsenatis]